MNWLFSMTHTSEHPATWLRLHCWHKTTWRPIKILTQRSSTPIAVHICISASLSCGLKNVGENNIDHTHIVTKFIWAVKMREKLHWQSVSSCFFQKMMKKCPRHFIWFLNAKYKHDVLESIMKLALYFFPHIFDFRFFIMCVF